MGLLYFLKGSNNSGSSQETELQELDDLYNQAEDTDTREKMEIQMHKRGYIVRYDPKTKQSYWVEE